MSTTEQTTTTATTSTTKPIIPTVKLHRVLFKPTTNVLQEITSQKPATNTTSEKQKSTTAATTTKMPITLSIFQETSSKNEKKPTIAPGGFKFLTTTEVPQLMENVASSAIITQSLSTPMPSATKRSDNILENADTVKHLANRIRNLSSPEARTAAQKLLLSLLTQQQDQQSTSSSVNVGNIAVAQKPELVNDNNLVILSPIYNGKTSESLLSSSASDVVQVPTTPTPSLVISTTKSSIRVPFSSGVRGSSGNNGGLFSLFNWGGARQNSNSVNTSTRNNNNSNNTNSNGGTSGSNMFMTMLQLPGNILMGTLKATQRAMEFFSNAFNGVSSIFAPRT